jgi:hypothetical protein
MTAPVLQIDELISQLVAFQRSGSRNDLKLRSFRHQAQGLLAHSPGDAHMALGIIASMEDREDEACREHEAALRCGWDRQRALNYAVTLQRFYRYDEAVRQAQNVMQREPLDLDAMEMMVTNAYFAGRFQLTAQLLAEYRERVPDRWTGDLAEIETEMQSIQPMIEQSFLTDDQIVAMQQPAWALMRTLKSGNRKITIKDFVGNDGQAFLSRTFCLPLTFEEAQALDDQLVRQLAEHDDWPLEKFITIFREQEAA